MSELVGKDIKMVIIIVFHIFLEVQMWNIYKKHSNQATRRYKLLCLEKKHTPDRISTRFSSTKGKISQSESTQNKTREKNRFKKHKDHQ